MAINTINVFGDKEDLAEIKILNEVTDESLVMLHSSYPNVLVTQYFKTEIKSTIDEVSNKSSLCFRKLIGNIINEANVWANGNTEKMMTSYSEEIYAAFGNMFTDFKYLKLSL